MLAIVAAGCGFGATNVATKLFGDDVDSSAITANAIAGARVGVGMGVAATIVNMTAFQRRAATAVVPISTSVQTFLPIVLEPFFLREHWGSAALRRRADRRRADRRAGRERAHRGHAGGQRADRRTPA